MKNKKGVSLSMETIAIVIIALLVLVFLVFIFQSEFSSLVNAFKTFFGAAEPAKEIFK